jgi:SAM-dependent methyltransferase
MHKCRRLVVDLPCQKMPLIAKRAYLSLITTNWEQGRVIAFVQRAVGRGGTVLDVGCGYGRNLKSLRASGIDAIGVEINSEIVKAVVASGLPCRTVEELERDTTTFDTLLMSHVIEHFAPRALFDFMDGYLDRLKSDGHLVIATPLMSNNFYDDFDHVRPYQPLGILMVFGRGTAQVQYYARNRLELCDIWFRRGPWRLNYSRLRFAKGRMRHLMQSIDLACALLFRTSFGLLGRTDGWVGLFKKIEG